MKLQHLIILLLIALICGCSETTEQKTATTETPAGTMEAEGLSDQERAAKRQKDAERIKYVVENVGGFGYGTIKPLIDEGIDVNATVHLVHRNPLPLLSLAITKEDVRLAEHLINLPECDINAEVGGTTPLYIAKLLGMKYLEDLLLEKGARLPASLNDEAALKYIRGQCADPMANSDFVQAIAKRDFIEIERLILKGRDSNFRVQTRAGDTVSLLSLALIHDANPLHLQLIRAQGTDFNTELSGTTPLYIAQLLGNSDMEKRLKSMGAKLPENPDKKLAMKVIFGEFPHALTKDKREIKNILVDWEKTDWGRIKQLIREGLDVNMKLALVNEDPAPLLFYVLAGKQPDLARLIIETESCDVNVKHADGTTAIMLADFLGYADIVQLLLQKGADPLEEFPKPVVDSLENLSKYAGIALTNRSGDYSQVHHALRDFRIPEKDEIYSNDYQFPKKLFKYNQVITTRFGFAGCCTKDGITLATMVLSPYGMGQSIISVWEHRDGKLHFVTNLERDLNEYYSGTIIDSFYRIDTEKTIIFGLTSGGDEGEGWGYYWCGLWTKPNKFKLLKKYTFSADDSEAYEYRHSFSPETGSVKIIETRIRYNADKTTGKDVKTQKEYNLSLDHLLKLSSQEK